MGKMARKGFLLLITVLIVSSCTMKKGFLSGKGHFLMHDMVGLSSENVFFMGKYRYDTRDFVFKSKFKPSKDRTVYYYITLKLGVIKKDFDLKTVWYDPQGKRVETIETRHDAERVAFDPRFTSRIFYHDLPMSSFADKPGKWRVELYVDGELIEERLFTILPPSEKGKKELAIEAGAMGGAKIYEDISVAQIGRWNSTGITVPAGAVVAVLAKGEIQDKYEPEKWRFPPWWCLRFKIGYGPVVRLGSGADSGKNPHNMNVIQNGGAGTLNFWINLDLPERKKGGFTATVLIWDQEHQERMEEDITMFINSRPGESQLRNLWIRMAFFLTNDAGDYSRAEAILRRLREDAASWSDADNSYIWVTSAINENYMGRIDRAKAFAEKALEFTERSGNRNQKGYVLWVMGDALSRLSRYQDALTFFEKSFEMAQQTGDINLYGQIEGSIGDALLQLNNPSDALAHFGKALEYRKKRDTNFRSKPYAYLGLGDAQSRLNRYEEAKKSYGDALMESEKVKKADSMWRAQNGLGWIAEKEGDNQKAFEHYAKAITIIESMRGKFTDPGLKALFMKDKLRVYERMIQLLQKMKRTPEALHYLERARARVMLDMLAEKGFSSKNKEENELLTQERALRKQIDEISMERGRIGFEGPQEIGEEISEAQVPEKQISELERLQAQHRAILEKIEKLNPELSSLISINPLKAREIQMLLDGETVLLEYFLGEEGRFVFVITREKVLAVPLEVDSKKLFQEIREFRTRAVDGITLDRLITKTYERPLSELYEMLIQPIEAEISVKKNLVIVPHGMLHYLPFQALLSREGKYLIESFTISYVPSASVLKYARAKNKGNRVDLFAVGNPATGLSPLPAAEVEVKEVSAIFDKKLVLTGQQATKPSVKSHGPQYDMILLSTHGEMIESDPLKSNLRFTPSEKDDGRLTVNEIFDMEIKANLVTLSACETALVRGETGDFPQGDDLIGLSRAFIHAGAPSVVASLWKVSDDSTVELMRAFYQNLKSMSKSEALRKAQLDLMKSSIRFHVERGSGGITQSINYQRDMSIECSHPFFWAPFILLGDWR
jgi:CHAT domain-containing protein